MNDIKEIMAAAITVGFISRFSAHISSKNAKTVTQFQIDELEKSGYIIVPKEPTDEMLKVLGNSNASDINIAKGIYQAMTEASQNDK